MKDVALNTRSRITFFPREHGATAMLLVPLIASAIIAGGWQPVLPAVLLVAVCAFAMKDPLVVLARRRMEGKREARYWVAVEAVIAAVCGAFLIWRGPVREWVLLALGSAAFYGLAVAVNVRNRQRAAWFQVASAIALTSTCIAVPLAIAGSIPLWAWQVWLLFALQAAAGIFAVHARLDARIALRRNLLAPQGSRLSAYLAAFALGSAMLAFNNLWIDAALTLAPICYLLELRRQRSPRSLETPLTRIGLQSLALSLVFAGLVTFGIVSRR